MRFCWKRRINFYTFWPIHVKINDKIERRFGRLDTIFKFIMIKINRQKYFPKDREMMSIL